MKEMRDRNEMCVFKSFHREGSDSIRFSIYSLSLSVSVSFSFLIFIWDSLVCSELFMSLTTYFLYWIHCSFEQFFAFNHSASKLITSQTHAMATFVKLYFSSMCSTKAFIYSTYISENPPCAQD